MRGVEIIRIAMIDMPAPPRYQKRLTFLPFWLTIVFGATGTGFIASGIATGYYRQALATVFGWTVGASVVSGLIRVLLLRGRVE